MVYTRWSAMSKLLQGALLQQAPSHSGRSWQQVRASPPRDAAGTADAACQELCAEKKMLEVIQDLPAAPDWQTTSGQTSGERHFDSCEDLCKEKDRMMAAPREMTSQQWTPAEGESRGDGPPVAVLTSIRCQLCGCTFCCVCSAVSSVRSLRSQYWSRPQDRYKLHVSVSIHEKVTWVRHALRQSVC